MSCTFKRARRNQTRLRLRHREIRIGVEDIVNSFMIDVTVLNSGDACQEFQQGWRSHADGIGHAGIFGNTPVGDSRRQVKNVRRAGFDRAVVDEFLEKRQLARFDQFEFRVRRREAPFTLSGSLTKKYIVVVTMRADAAAGCRKTNHQVIDAPVGNERSCVEEVSEIGQVLFHILDQQRPVLWR